MTQNDALIKVDGVQPGQVAVTAILMDRKLPVASARITGKAVFTSG